MAVCTNGAPARLLADAGKERPGRELVVAWLFFPLASRVAAPLLRLGVPPPAVVAANAAAGLAAAALLAADELVAAALLLQLKTLLDNADGLLARASGRVSLLGRYLDTEADLLVNAALFAALAATTDRLWLALAAFLALTLVLSADFNLSALAREAAGEPAEQPPATGGRSERALAFVYRALFAPQDRLLRWLSRRRLERVAAGAAGEPGRKAALAYHDPLTVDVLANLGLSTQLVALGVCLLLGAPEAYLWLALASLLVLPPLQLRRERLARRALLGR